MDTMQMLHRIMRNTRPRRPFNPRGPRGDGPFGKGGGSDPRVPRPRYQTLGATPQVAGLAGLFGGIKKGINPEQIMATPTQLPNFPQQQMATPMQPEVIEEQQQMEILGQPKQFAGGGIVNALMATPIGQAAIKEYAQGGEVEAQQIFEMAQTGANIEDILSGSARFFTTPRYRHAEIISDISDTLGVGTPIKKKKRIEEQYQDDAGGSVGHEPEMDAATGVQAGLLSETNYDPNEFKDYVEIPPIGLLGLGLNLAQKAWHDRLEYDPSIHKNLPYNFGAEPGSYNVNPLGTAADYGTGLSTEEGMDVDMDDVGAGIISQEELAQRGINTWGDDGQSPMDGGPSEPADVSEAQSLDEAAGIDW
jgi:hypothetical protein